MRIIHQISAAMLTSLLLVVALVAVSMVVSIDQGFASYVRALEEARLKPAVERLGRFYAEEGSWARMEASPKRFRSMLDPKGATENRPPKRAERRGPPKPPPKGGHRPDPPPKKAKRSHDPFELPPRASLYDAQRRPVIGRAPLNDNASQLPIEVEGRIVGWLGIREVEDINDALDLQYLARLQWQLGILAFVALLLGLLAGWLLTRRILQPIDALSAGTSRLIAGDYDTRIGLARKDELGQLSRDFDALALRLREDEMARKQWVADTSHELRTPITILRSEIEAVIDGVRPASLEAFSSLHAEILRLGNLVDDLGELARSDRGVLTIHSVALSPIAVLEESIESVRGLFDQHGITMDIALEGAHGALIRGDEARLQQIFTNLLSNSMRYTDRGGASRIRASAGEAGLDIVFEDTAPAPPAEALPHLFDRFYRVERSRSRAFGGSGLGLSICKGLVEAQGGTIHASLSPMGGLCVRVCFPTLPTESRG